MASAASSQTGSILSDSVTGKLSAVLALFGEHAQDIAILTHDRFGNGHLGREVRIGCSEPNSIRRFTHKNSIAGSDLQARQQFLRQGSPRRIADLRDLELHVHTGVITEVSGPRNLADICERMWVDRIGHGSQYVPQARTDARSSSVCFGVDSGHAPPAVTADNRRCSFRHCTVDPHTQSTTPVTVTLPLHLVNR